jgi:hypothetical protein
MLKLILLVLLIFKVRLVILRRLHREIDDQTAGTIIEELRNWNGGWS